MNRDDVRAVDRNRAEMARQRIEILVHTVLAEIPAAPLGDQLDAVCGLMDFHDFVANESYICERIEALR